MTLEQKPCAVSHHLPVRVSITEKFRGLCRPCNGNYQFCLALVSLVGTVCPCCCLLLHFLTRDAESLHSANVWGRWS